MVLWTFIAATFFGLITPGPGVLTTAGIGANYGFQAGLRFVLGLFAGTNAVFFIVAAGLFATLESIPVLRMILAIASLLFLFYLALKIALAGSKIAFINPGKPPGFWGGLMLQFVNPKAYAVNAFFLSNFPIMPDAPITEVAVKCLIINVFWVPIHFLWLGMGVWLQKLDLAPKWQRLINIMMALAMLLVVALAAFIAKAG
jgi:threonine/homoserine/homoserine lactone efflux protein